MKRRILFLLILWLTACQADPRVPVTTRQPVATIAQATAAPSQTATATATTTAASTHPPTATITRPAASPTSVAAATSRPTTAATRPTSTPRPPTSTPAPALVLRSSFGWGNHLQVVDAAGPRTVAFQVGRGDLVNLELYSLPFEQFIEHYVSNDRPPLDESAIGPVATSPADLVWQWQMETAADAPELFSSAGSGGTAQQAVIPADVPPGLYLLNLPTLAGLNDQIIIVLTRHTIATTVTPGGLAVWVTEINGRPVANAEVEFWLGNGSIGGDYFTDDDGLLLASLPEIPTLVLALVNGEMTILPIERNRIVADGDNLRLVDWNGQPLGRHWWNIFTPYGDLGISQTGTDGRLGQYWENTLFSAGGDWYTENPLWNSFSNGWQRQAFPAVVRHYAVAFILDRPYLHPGHTLSTRVVVRQEAAGGLLQLPAGTPVTLSLHDPENTLLQTVNLTTGDFGTVHSQFTLPAEAAPGEYSLELVVDGESHRQFFWLQPVPAGNYQVIVTADTTQFSSNQPVQATVLVRDSAGLPATHVPVSLSAYLLEDDPFLHNFNPVSPGWRPNADLVGEGETDNAGRFIVTIPADSEALFYCGPCALAATVAGDASTGDFTVIQGPKAWPRQSNGFYELPIQLDRQNYQAGDIASLTIASTFSGPALLLAGAGNHLSYHRLIELTAPQTVVQLPAVAAGQPNRHIIIQAWHETTDFGITEVSRADTRLFTGRATLNISLADKALLVTVTPDRASYAPGETAALTIHVTNSRGEPVSAELSLSLADDGLFTHPADNLLPTLYRGLPDLSNLFTSMGWFRMLIIPTLDGGPGSGPPTVPALYFDDAAAWFPSLLTDANGEATVSLTLPNRPGHWRLSAQAVTADTQVGEGYVVLVTE